MPRRVGIQQPKFAPSRWIGASMGNHDQSPYVGSVHRLSRGVSQFSRYSLHDLWSDDVRCMVRGTIRTVQLRSWGIRPAFQAKSQTLVDTFDGQIEFLTFLDRKPLNLEHLKTVQKLWTIQAYELCLKHSYHFHTHMFNNSLWFQARKEQPGRPQATHWGRKPQAIVKSTDFDLWNLWRVRFGYIIDQIWPNNYSDCSADKVELTKKLEQVVSSHALEKAWRVSEQLGHSDRYVGLAKCGKD